MEPLMEALTPILVVSIALQQLLELLDPVLDAVARDHKKWILSAVSLVVALALTLLMGLRLLASLGIERAAWLDPLVTALFMTSGTKGFNELLKWIGYKKEGAKQALPAAAAQRV